MRGPALIVSLFLSTGANAMTGTEFLDKMNDQQRAATYLTSSCRPSWKSANKRR